MAQAENIVDLAAIRAKRATTPATLPITGDVSTHQLNQEVNRVAALWNSGVMRRRRTRFQETAAEEARIEAAVAKHGSIIAAMRAGAI